MTPAPSSALGSSLSSSATLLVHGSPGAAQGDSGTPAHDASISVQMVDAEADSETPALPPRLMARATYTQPRGDRFAQTISEYKCIVPIFCGDLPRLSEKHASLHALPQLPMGSKLLRNNGESKHADDHSRCPLCGQIGLSA